MTGERYQDLPPVKRRRLILRAVVRGLLNAAVLVVLYYVLPLDRPRDCDTAVRLLIGLLVFAGVMVWGVRSIAGSRYPGGAGGRGAGSGPAVVPGAVRLHLLPDGTGLRGELHPAADPHRRPVLHGDRHSPRWGSGTSPPNPRPPGSCSSSRCSPTSPFSAPEYECSWGRCSAAGNEDRIQAPVRPPRDGLPALGTAPASMDR